MDTHIYSNESLSVKMRLIDNQYGVFIYDWHDSKEHRLFSYKFRNDTLFLNDSEDELDISIDVYYSNNTDLGKDSISVETSYTHLLEKGQGSFSDFQYVINNEIFTPIDKEDPLHKLILKQEKPIEFVSIKQSVSNDRTIPINLSDNYNSIKIKFTQIFSTYFSVIDIEQYFPFKTIIDDIEYIVVLNQ